MMRIRCRNKRGSAAHGRRGAAAHDAMRQPVRLRRLAVDLRQQVRAGRLADTVAGLGHGRQWRGQQGAKAHAVKAAYRDVGGHGQA
ncbi:hypothetical protein G6F56_014649 [Rhizopus delemar]|nr:hypothetical protein G6F56_014649 [Rhizopus delemar]